MTDVWFYVTVVEEASGIDVDDILQLRKKNFFFLLLLDMILHIRSIWAYDRNLLSTIRPSRRCSVTFSIF